MKNSREMSIKDRITIRMKNAKPLSWWVYVIVCAALLLLLALSSLFSDWKAAVEAPEELSDKSNQVRVTVIGEVSVSDAVRVLASRTSYADLLRNLRDYWDASDYVLASAAGPVLTYDVSHYTSTRESGADSVFLRPAALRGFAAAGITGLNFANDDAYNYGLTGIESTFREMEKSTLDYFGIAETSDDTFYRLLTFTGVNADGERQERAVAVLGVNDVIMANSTVREERAGIVNSSIDDLYLRVYEASQAADLTIAYIHSGESYENEVTDDQELLAHALIDSGADIVVGTHSHMVQTMECYNGGLILYGLGDVFSASDYSLLLDSAMLDVVVDEAGEISAYVTPLRIDNGMPQSAGNFYHRNRIIRTLTSGLSEGEYTVTEDGQILVSLGSLPEDPVYQPGNGDPAEEGAEEPLKEEQD